MQTNKTAETTLKDIWTSCLIDELNLLSNAPAAGENGEVFLRYFCDVVSTPKSGGNPVQRTQFFGGPIYRTLSADGAEGRFAGVDDYKAAWFRDPDGNIIGLMNT